MSEIVELERRITAALERIGNGLERINHSAVTGAAVAPVDDASGDLTSLRDALDEEKTANAQLTERLRVLKDREAQSGANLEARVDQLTRQLDVQGLELQRMRKTAIQLRETLRNITEAQTEGALEPHLINKAMLVELEALRATRAAEIIEMDEILAELSPIIEEAKADA